METEKKRTTNEYYLQGIAKGDTDIIQEFYEAYLGSVVDFVQRNSGTLEDAKDIFQDAFMVIFQKLKKNELNLYVNLHTYLYAICRNTWLKRLKKQGKVADFELEDNRIEDESSSYEDNMEEQGRYKLYRSKFAQLGADCQKILGFYFAKKKMSEIAQLMGFGSEGYAKKKKYKCQQKLIELIRADSQFNELSTS